MKIRLIRSQEYDRNKEKTREREHVDLKLELDHCIVEDQSRAV